MYIYIYYQVADSLHCIDKEQLYKAVYHLTLKNVFLWFHRNKELEQQELKNDSQATTTKKKFAIDLRTPEEMQQTIEDQETEA